MFVSLFEVGFLPRNFFITKIAGKMPKRIMGCQRLIISVRQFEARPHYGVTKLTTEGVSGGNLFRFRKFESKFQLRAGTP